VNRARAAAVTVALLVAGLALAGCGGRRDAPASTLSKSQRDSVLAESALPGARAVKGALGAADSAQARAARAAEPAGR
jgi:hypothetical protein